MRYLRMLSNAVIAGGVASGYFITFVLQLRAVSLEPATCRRSQGARPGLRRQPHGGVLRVIVMQQILDVEVCRRDG